MLAAAEEQLAQVLHAGLSDADLVGEVEEILVPADAKLALLAAALQPLLPLIHDPGFALTPVTGLAARPVVLLQRLRHALSARLAERGRPHDPQIQRAFCWLAAQVLAVPQILLCYPQPA